MTTIVMPFAGYPALKRGKAELFDGFAEIKLSEIPALPVCPPNVKQLTIPARPLQKSLRWRFVRLTLTLTGLVISDTIDLERWVTGRFWPRISTLLYAQFCEERGLFGHAETYRLLAGR